MPKKLTILTLLNIFILFTQSCPEKLNAKFYCSSCKKELGDNFKEAKKKFLKHIKDEHTSLDRHYQKGPFYEQNLEQYKEFLNNVKKGLITRIQEDDVLFPLGTPHELCLAAPSFYGILVRVTSKNPNQNTMKNTCTCCKRSFTTLRRFMDHITIQHANFFFCLYDYCHKHFTNQKELSEHIITHLQNDRQNSICPCCGKIYKAIRHFCKHIKSHKMPNYV